MHLLRNQDLRRRPSGNLPQNYGNSHSGRGFVRIGNTNPLPTSITLDSPQETDRPHRTHDPVNRRIPGTVADSHPNRVYDTPPSIIRPDDSYRTRTARPILIRSNEETASPSTLHQGTLDRNNWNPSFLPASTDCELPLTLNLDRSTAHSLNLRNFLPTPFCFPASINPICWSTQELGLGF